MIKTKKLHLLLVALQFGGIVYFLVSGTTSPKNILIALIYIIAVLMGLWAVLSMNNQTINVLPDARDNATLTKKGPYKFIRHPMYTSVLTLLLGLLVNDFTYIRLLIYGCMILVLLYKIRIEERILLVKYTDYKDYTTTTKKLIPLLY